MAITYTLVGNAAGKYALDGTTLRVAGTLTAGTDTISIKATDSNGWERTKSFPILVNSGTFTPAGETGLEWWFKADDAASRTIDVGVTQFADKSGKNRHATIATAAEQPTVALASVNGKDTLLFDASDRLIVPDHPVALIHIFAVAKNINQLSNRHIVRKGYTGNELAYSLRFTNATTAQFYVRNSEGVSSVFLSLTVPTGVCLLEASWDGTTVSLSCDGGTPVTTPLNGTALKDTIEPLGIGCNGVVSGGTESLGSNFCEVFAYNGKKTAEVAAAARAYLKAQWGTA